MYSRPLRGSTRPKVEMMVRSWRPSFALMRIRPGHVPGSVEAELVLNVDHVNIRVADGSGSGAIAARVALADAPADLAVIGPDHVRFVDGSDPGAYVGIRRPSSRH